MWDYEGIMMGSITVQFRGSRIFFLLTVITIANTTSRAQVWEHLGLPNDYITGIAVKSSDTIYACVLGNYSPTPGTIFRTTNSGLTWDTLVSNASTLDLELDPANPQIVYAALGGSIFPPYGILKTTDGGDNWFHADSGLTVDSGRGVQEIEIDPLHPETLCAGTGGPSGGDLYRTTDGGMGWISIGTPEMQGGISSIAIDPISTNTVYAGTPYLGLFKSTDGGGSWELTSLPSNGTFVNGLGIDPSSTNVLYAGVGNSGFYRSTDGGASWTQTTTGLPPDVTGALVKVSSVTGEVFGLVVPDSVGLFKSTDQALTWTRVGGLNSATGPSALSISRDQSQLYIGIRDSGIYRTNILVSSVLDSRAPLPSATILNQNYPNPFNPATTIKYDLPRNSRVNLKVYDVLGREVLSLVDGVVTVGAHQVTLNASDLSSGVYFCRLKAGDFSDTKRLLLLK